MSETSFPVNDLLRRRLQTSLVVISLTLCVASTLFLLLFGGKLGFGILSTAEGRLTASFSTVFSQFMFFLGLLIFVVGAVIVSFMVFVMMSQRVKDIGLMRAAGCPNDLIFGYFVTELLIVTLGGCSLGVILGVLLDFASTNLFLALGFQVSQAPIDFWLVLLVFVLFFALALIVGAKPILDTTRVEPARAISPVYHLGLARESEFKVTSKSGFELKMAFRSLFRRKSATVRVVVCLTVVFILVTVAVAGGIIADQTTENWVERAVGRDVVLIAHRDVIDQYKLLLSKFYETTAESQFDYSNERYLMPEEILAVLNSTAGVTKIDVRLILKVHVKEISGYTIDPDTMETRTVGDSREGESVLVGVEPQKVLNDWLLDGQFLGSDQSLEAVIGDSLAQKMFSVPVNQSIMLFDKTFDVIGVCVDQVNNGNVTYVPLKVLQSISGVSKPNIAMIKISPSANRSEVLSQLRASVSAINSEFAVFELDEMLDKNLSFLGYMWSTVMFLPLFSMAAASLCLVAYVMLAITEQRQEFGVLRALGAKPRTVVWIVAGQSLMVLLASYSVGIALGIIATLLILMPEPFVTSYIVLEVAGWLLAALAVTFVFSLYPAVRFAKKPIREIMT